MSVQTPDGRVINGENADNFEDIEKQFAVKGESSNPTLRPSRGLTYRVQSSST